ncbi:MAG: hypothetical protein IJO94_06390 [Firmicutes bacterium]|nr:hypothetical protein [Bacillota bacterium]MBQ6811014.1 hypothetical protein [Bacillota bacterium]
MFYLDILNQLYKELCNEPDFPTDRAEQLWNTLPSFSRDLGAMIYLLPFGNDIAEREKANAKVLTLLTLSAFVHGDLEKNAVFQDGEAVLFGDYLFALAFSLLPQTIEKERAGSLLERSYRFCEHRLSHQKAAPNTEDCLRYAAEDYGQHLKSIAEEAAEQSGMEQENKEKYARCAEAIGTLWGVLCENYEVDPSPLQEQAKTFAAGLPIETDLCRIISKLGRSIG